jgi:hypothetical protein
LIARVHELNRVVSAAQREMLSCLAELETHEAWLDDGAYDMAHRVSMQLGVSRWKAERWVSAGAALESLPAIAASFAAAEVGIDKVVELTGFATPDDEEALLAWAGDVTSGAIRRRGEELRRAERVEVEQIEEDRWLAWRWTDEGKRLLLEAELPAAQGAVVTEALDRLAGEIPAMPGEESRLLIGRRRADALAVACASGRDAGDDARSGSSATATARARSPDAGTAGSRRRTTSDGGHEAGGPSSTTWRSSARSTIDWCTSTGGTPSAHRPARCDGSGPTASGTERALTHRRARSRRDTGSLDLVADVSPS